MCESLLCFLRLTLILDGQWRKGGVPFGPSFTWEIDIDHDAEDFPAGKEFAFL